MGYRVMELGAAGDGKTNDGTSWCASFQTPITTAPITGTATSTGW